jgi:hypothetical protein
VSASLPRRYGTARDEECAEYQLKVFEIFVDQLLHALPGRLPENDFSLVLADPYWETVDFVPLAASATICNVRPNGRGHESLASEQGVRDSVSLLDYVQDIYNKPRTVGVSLMYQLCCILLAAQLASFAGGNSNL